MTHELYLDANATSPVLPAAIAAAADAMGRCYGNPSSGHAAGLHAKVLLDEVRERARRLIGAGAGRVIFNSGATEGIQTAVLSALCAVRERQSFGEAVGDLLLYGATEHKAVPEALAHWNRLLGTQLTLRALPVDGDGRHRLDVLRQLAPRAALVCTMAANNETGAITDLAAIESALLVSASKAYWMVDSVQALGKLPLALESTRIDYAPFSAHKLYGPKGIGLLYVRDGAPYTALMAGGGQEGGQRAGTENMGGIAALGAVFEALETGDTFRTPAQLHAFRERLVASLRAALPGIVFNTPLHHSLPTTVNFSVAGVSGSDLIDVFDAAGMRVSGGSACSAAKAAPSYVLEAMGLASWRSASAVRLSFGPAADDAFIEDACERIAHCGRAMRKGGLLTPSLNREDDVVRLAVKGATTWLALDQVSRTCVVIDPVGAVGERIASMIRSRDYRVRGIISTSSGGDQLSDRASLAALLDGQIDFTATADPYGWPAASVGVTLGDGSAHDAIALGGKVLARVPHSGGASQSYLLGACDGGALHAKDVRFTFSGAAPAELMNQALQGMAALLNDGAIVCPSHDTVNLVCTTPSAGFRPEPPLDSMELQPAELERFLRERPDAMLVDVREPWEHEAGRPGIQGRSAINVPMSRLPSQIAQWLGIESRPLIFICRLGTRSQRAAQCLHRAGYAQAWHLGGGLALHIPARKIDLSQF